jgi:ATP-dependent Clp protease ATP-binding subunit ClpB
MTSNIGSTRLIEGLGSDGTIAPATRDGVMGDLRRAMRPEFLNRIDEIVLFKPLTKPEIRQIVGLQLERLAARLAAQTVTLDASEEALTFIADAGYDPVYGARPIKRYLQRHVETPLARLLLAGDVPEHAGVALAVRGGRLAFDIAPPAPGPA